LSTLLTTPTRTAGRTKSVGLRAQALPSAQIARSARSGEVPMMEHPDGAGAGADTVVSRIGARRLESAVLAGPPASEVGHAPGAGKYSRPPRRDLPPRVRVFLTTSKDGSPPVIISTHPVAPQLVPTND
jgi:hypothetical protein